MVRVNCARDPVDAHRERVVRPRDGRLHRRASPGRSAASSWPTARRIFLDEIGDLPPEVQVKLLRVLEERQIERLGSPKPIHVDTRVIAATHRNLEQRIAEGAFREDLFYRLNVFPIRVPPLRERIEDIPLLVWHLRRGVRGDVRQADRGDLARQHRRAAALRWPGNIRELRNVVERAMIVATGPRLTIPVPAASRRRRPAAARSWPTCSAITSGTCSSRRGWRIRGIGGAADRLGLRPTTLETRMAKLGSAATDRRVERAGARREAKPADVAPARGRSRPGVARTFTAAVS